MPGMMTCDRCKGTTPLVLGLSPSGGWRALLIGPGTSVKCLCPNCVVDLGKWIKTPPPQDGQAGNGN